MPSRPHAAKSSRARRHPSRADRGPTDRDHPVPGGARALLPPQSRSGHDAAVLEPAFGGNAAAADDPIRNEWFPVASRTDLRPGSVVPFVLLGERCVLLCSGAGVLTALPDTCPHRGAQLSLGTFDGSRLICAYHGWRFGTDGRCEERPAHPGVAVPVGCHLRALGVREQYGLVWVCLGDGTREPPKYDEYANYPGRTGIIGPKELSATGPRVVENFLDVAHLPFVHVGYLGREPHTEYREHDVVLVNDELRAVDVVVWQPNPGPRATEGGDVRYEYGVSHPYAARLTKIPSDADGGALGGFSLLLVASPETEARCRVWILSTVFDPDADIAAYDTFNELIFSQDVAMVESQLPKRLPLDIRSEVHQKADKMSLAYRRWLLDRGIRYGTSLNENGGFGRMDASSRPG